MKKNMVIMLMMLLGFQAHAQVFTEIKQETKTKQGKYLQLKIGDSLPHFLIPKVINNSTGKLVHTSDFKDQLLIIDFWATDCIPCVEALPRMDSLAEIFGNKVKVLPVTYQKEQWIRDFFKNNRLIKNLPLESVVEDTIFQDYFPHITMPHDVWVYKGKVVGITAIQYVDAQNISRVLKGDIPNWRLKNDYFVFDEGKTLFKPDSTIVSTDKLEYAGIFDNIKELNKGTVVGGGPSFNINRDTLNKKIRTYFVNQEPFIAYNVLINQYLKRTIPLVIPAEYPFLIKNNVVWEVIDRNKYQWISKERSGYIGDWNNLHTFCFESIHPDTGQTDQQVYGRTLKELNMLLGLNVRWEKRKEKILVLIRTTKEDKLRRKAKIETTIDQHRKGIDPHIIIKGKLHQYRDFELRNLVTILNLQENNPYVFDETGYTEGVDLDLNFSSWTDIIGLRKSLRRYGLELKEEERLVDKFVFSEVDGGKVLDAKMMEEAKAKKEAQKGLLNPVPEENKAFLEANKKKPGIITLPSGLQYKIIKEGKGTKPDSSNKVVVNYTGTLVNGKIFDSSFETGKAAIFGIGDVIPG